MSDIQQSDIFFMDTKTLSTAKEKVELSKNIPLGYIPVTFCSKSVMGPPVLHFRNYSMGELLELTSSNEENQLNVLVNKVLNNMCFEKFDCSKLHLENIKEILLTIHLNFWGKLLSKRPYYIETQIQDYDKEENIGYVDIDITKINVKDVNEKFKNPFSIVDDITGKRVKFCLPTVEQMFITDRAIKDKYADEEQKFIIVRSRISTKKALIEKELIDEANKINVSTEEEDCLNDFEQRKAKDYLKYLQCQLLVAIDNINLETIDEKLEAFDSKVDATTWIRYAEAVSKYADFGIDENFTFKLNNEDITRRFSFRCVEFIPSVEQKSNTGYSIRFDD